MIVDTHCHLYLEEFDADRDALVKAACDKGIGQIYLPAIDSETHQRVIDTEIQYPGVCHAMMALLRLWNRWRTTPLAPDPAATAPAYRK